MKRFIELMPLLPAFLLLWQLTRSPVLPLVLSIVALVVPQKRTDKPAPAIVPTALFGAIGFLVNQQLAVSPELPLEQAHYRNYVDFLASAAAALATGAATRRRWTKPEGGEPLTLGLVLLSIACTAYGATLWSVALALAWVVTFSLTTVVEARRALMSTRGKLRTIVALALGVVITTILAWAIPWLHAKAFDFFMRSLAGSSSGLVDRIALEHNTNITLSDERVLRIRSSQKGQEKQQIDYLRGYVFSRYAYGEWQSTGLPGAVVLPPRSASLRSFSVELASPDFLVLLPRDSRNVTLPAKSIRVDSLGVPFADRPIESYSFELGIRDAFPISGPQREDSLVPASVRSALEPVAQAWTTNVAGTKEQLDAINLAFHSNFRWSLQSVRSIPGDPVVDFVLRERVGHCEYFASAMALMARSIGIPARVVNGYRVIDYNRLDESYVVRKSHAHAWIEAWVEGKGWLTYDPTPDTEDMVTHELTLFESVLDLINARPKSASLAFLGIVGMMAAALSFRPRLFVKQKQVEGEPILIAVAALVRHIAERSRKRLPGEALLVWARQVATADELSVIERYSELRWGGQTDADSVECEAERLLMKTAERKCRRVR